MSDIEDILNEIQLDHIEGGDIDFDEDEFNGFMDHLQAEDAGSGSVSSHYHHNNPPPGSHHNNQSRAHHHPSGVRSSTQANLDELESLVAELTNEDAEELSGGSSGGGHHHGHGHHQHGHHGHNNNAHQSVSLTDQPTFDSSLDALLVDLGGIGERDSVPPTSQKRSNHHQQGAHNPHGSEIFEDLLLDLTGTPSQPNRNKANSIAQNKPQEPIKPAQTSSGKKQPINPRDSAAYVDDLESLMGELIGSPSTSGPQKNPRSNSIAQSDRSPQQTMNRPQQQQQSNLQRGPSRSGNLTTHQESEDLDLLMNELTSPQSQSQSQSRNTVSKTYTGSNSKPSQPVPAQRQPTNTQQQQRKPQTIPEGDDLESLMADLVPTMANKGRQSTMPAQNKVQNQNSDVSELDSLMANLYPPNIHGKKPGNGGQQQRTNQRVSVATDVNNDLDDMINNLQSGYGMVEQPTPVSNRPQKPSTYSSNNPNNPHAVYNPNMNNPNNPHAVYNPPANNAGYNNPNAGYNNSNAGYNNSNAGYNNSNAGYNNNAGFNQAPTSASRTNTNQTQKPSRAGPTSRDLSALMDDLNSPVDNFNPNPQQPVSRKPPEPKLAKGMCAGCRKYISSTQKIQAMGREYHPEHFQCSTCNKVIGSGNFFEKEGQPQCEGCYQSVFCSRCANCSQPITSHCVTALGQSWHPDCFACGKCRTPFNNSSFFVKNGKAYCGVCVEDLHSQRCRGCNQPIRGTMINAVNTIWHPEHFVCQQCHQPFPGGVFYEVDGLPYCEAHYQTIRR